MVKGGPGRKKASMRDWLAYSIRLKLSDVYDVYDFWTEHHSEELSKLDAQWESLSEEERESDRWMAYFDDEGPRLAYIRRELGYTMAILLCSVAEDCLKRLKRKEYEEYCRDSADQLRGLNFLERYLHFHRNAFGTDFSSGPVPVRKRGPFLDLPTDMPYIDAKLLTDFVWARNKIVHHRGVVSETEVLSKTGAKRRTVPVLPLRGELFDDGLPPHALRPSEVRIYISREYLEQVTQHLVAFFDRVIED